MRWRQHWEDVLFVHVPVSRHGLAGCLPRGLVLDTFDGQAYLGFIFFRLHVRAAGLPCVPGFSFLQELNVRTYVRCGERAGIVFLRMYADNRLAVAASRLLTPLRYDLAQMSAEPSADGCRRYGCVASSSEFFEVSFHVAAPYDTAKEHSLAAWLIERYTLFVDTPAGLIAADVEHPPWRIAPAAGLARLETLTARFAPSCGSCLLHHSPGVAATFHPFRPIESTPNHVALAPTQAAARRAPKGKGRRIRRQERRCAAP